LQAQIGGAHAVGHGRSLTPPPTLREQINRSITWRVESSGSRFFLLRKPAFIRGAIHDFSDALGARFTCDFEWYSAWERIGKSIFDPWEPGGSPAVIPWRDPDIAQLVAGRPDLIGALIRWVRRSCEFFEARKSDQAFARFLRQICRDRGPFGRRVALTFAPLLAVPHPPASAQAHRNHVWMETRKAALDRALSPRPQLRAALVDWVTTALAGV
jgi:hypothetical protein